MQTPTSSLNTYSAAGAVGVFKRVFSYRIIRDYKIVEKA